MKKLVILVAILSVMFLGVTITSPTVAHAVPNVCAEHPEQPGCQGGGGGEGGGDTIINNGGEGGQGGTGIGVGIGIGGEGGQGGAGGAGGAGGDASASAEGGDASASASAGDNNNTVTVEGDTYEAKRDLVGAPTIGVPNTGVYTEQSTPTGNLQKMQNILIFQYEFTYKQLKALAAYNLPVSERAKVRAKYYATDDDADLTDDTRITAILVETDKEGNITRPAGEYTPAVHITVEGKSSTTTVSAFAKAAIAAMKGHCDKIIITGEGSKKMMEAGGFGLMLGTSVMTLSDGAKNATATASVGGLGYASAWAGYGYCPWLQAVGAISR